MSFPTAVQICCVGQFFLKKIWIRSVFLHLLNSLLHQMKWLRGKNQYDVLIIKNQTIRHDLLSLIFSHPCIWRLLSHDTRSNPSHCVFACCQVWFHISLLCNDIITPPVSRLTAGPWPGLCSAPRDQRSVTESLYPSTRRGRAGTRRARPVPRQRPVASLAQSLSRHNKRLLLLVFWAPRHSPPPLTAEDLSQVGWYATGSGSF